MKQNWRFLFITAVLVVFGVVLGACATSAGANPLPAPSAISPSPSLSPSPTEDYSTIQAKRYGLRKYTQADYDLAMSFMTEGWQNRSVADLKKEDAMEKALTAELTRLAKELGGTSLTIERPEVNYDWGDYR